MRVPLTTQPMMLSPMEHSLWGSGATTGTVNWPASPTKTLKVTDVSAAVAGSAIDMTNGGTLQIGGAFTLANLTFTPGAGTVVFNGAGAQAIPSATFNHLATAPAATKRWAVR